MQIEKINLPNDNKVRLYSKQGDDRNSGTVLLLFVSIGIKYCKGSLKLGAKMHKIQFIVILTSLFLQIQMHK